MPSSQLKLRNRNGQFRRGFFRKVVPSRSISTDSSNLLSLEQRKRKRKQIDLLSSTFKQQHLSHKQYGSQRIKGGIRRSRRIKCQRGKSTKRHLVRYQHKAKGIKKAKRIKRRTRKKASSSSLVANHNIGSDNSMIKCVLCNQRFSIHMKQHHCSMNDTLDDRHFVCFMEECDFKSNDDDAFKEHMNNKHRIYRNLYKCQYCNKRYDTKLVLKYHENNHLNNAKFECCLCKRRFPILSAVKNHRCLEKVERRKLRIYLKGGETKETETNEEAEAIEEQNDEMNEVYNTNNNTSVLYKEKLELEIYIQTHHQLENITCANEEEYRGKLDVLIKKQSELEAMYHKLQNDGTKRQKLMPIIHQINERFLNSINKIKSKLNKHDSQ